jgi:hypothetical protein
MGFLVASRTPGDHLIGKGSRCDSGLAGRAWALARLMLPFVAACSPVSCSSAESSLPPVETEASMPDQQSHTVLTARMLEADGPGVGLTAYQLIRNFGGVGSIESPDLYLANHPGAEHIFEDSDAVVGNHFVFVIHRDLDIDRDRLVITDRQRNEIKTYDVSEKALKAFEGETFILTWKFKINADMAVSTYFSHFFQIKAKGGNDRYPILTISGAERDGEDGIEVRHSPSESYSILQRRPWSEVAGEWLEVYCRVTFAETGQLRLIVNRLRDGRAVFDIDETALDFWRGEEDHHFVRPKWGIYRSLLDRENLRPEEEVVRFADFSVQKVMLTD